MPERRLSLAATHLARLLIGGVVGGHAGAALVIATVLIARGPRAAVSGAVAAVVVLVFFVVGHAVQLRYADAAPERLLVAALGSYAVRVLALGALLGVALGRPDLPWDADALALAAIATVVGWVAGEIWAFRRLRVPVFDPPEPPDASG